MSGGGGATILQKADGDEAAYLARFEEGKKLGEGEFGVVNLVHERSSADGSPEGARTVFACKTLRKGAVFKDNTLYSPLSPEVLRGEVEILSTLGGDHNCLNLIGVYETPKKILMVTECCSGGEMLEYLSNLQDDLRTEDVSRISFQILDAISHCAANHIIHRDIKPENTMFLSSAKDAPLRLIDFGSGTNKKLEGDLKHTTFAGTPFYNSPEMFQKTYTTQTDVWSVGVTLYVLVAGYPSENLQKAFNHLLSNKRTTLKTLPGMDHHEDMPESYFEMLDGLLKYKPSQRSTAKSMLDQEFVRFHSDLIDAEKEEDDEGNDDTVPSEMPSSIPSNRRRSQLLKASSIRLTGSVRRHSTFLSFQKFERSLTTAMATMLTPDEITKLLSMLDSRYAKDTAESAIEVMTNGIVNLFGLGSGEPTLLHVIKVDDLKALIEKELNNPSL